MAQVDLLTFAETIAYLSFGIVSGSLISFYFYNDAARGDWLNRRSRYLHVY